MSDFKPGDIVRSEVDVSGIRKVGDVFEVLDRPQPAPYRVPRVWYRDNDGDTRHGSAAEFSLIARAGERVEFKVGDVVKCVEASGFSDLVGVVGERYTVSRLAPFTCVVLDGKEPAENCASRFRLVHRPVEAEPVFAPAPSFKVGDVVEAVRTSATFAEGYKVGDRLTVSGIIPPNPGDTVPYLKFEGRHGNSSASNFRLAQCPAKAPVPVFASGDRVRCIEEDPRYGKVGEEFTVTTYTGGDVPTIQVAELDALGLDPGRFVKIGEAPRIAAGDAKVGDRLLCLAWNGERFKAGKVYEVGLGGLTDEFGVSCAGAFVLHIGTWAEITPPTPAGSGFKVGDVFVDSLGFIKPERGDHFTVTHILDGLHVEAEPPTKGSGKVRWHVSNMKLIQQPAPAPVIKPGDFVTIRAEVGEIDHEGDLVLKVKHFGDTEPDHRAFVSPSFIVSHEPTPEPLKVGDRVKHPARRHPGTIKALFDGWAAVGYEGCDTPSTWKIDALTRI